MEKKKNNKGLILLIIILIILVLGLCGYIVYDKLLKVDKNKSNNTTMTTKLTTTKIKSDEDDLENNFVAYCNDNKNEILSSISKLRNDNFNSKYNKDKFIAIGLDDIVCERTAKYSDNKLIIEIEYEINNNSYSESFVYNIKDSAVNSFNGLDWKEESYDEYIALDAFNYAKELVAEDEEAYNLSHPDFYLGTFKDKTYNGDNIYILKICEYKGEEEYCPKHYYDYKIDFNTKTFEKINIDVE